MSGWTEAVSRELVLEPHVPVHVELTDSFTKRLSQRVAKEYRASVPLLMACNLDPYLYFTVRVGHDKVLLDVFTCSVPESERPGRYLKERPARIEVVIHRASHHRPVTVRLGSQRDITDFESMRSVQLIRYAPDEEKFWRVEAKIERFE